MPAVKNAARLAPVKVPRRARSAQFLTAPPHDLEARRFEVIKAVWRVIARQGLEGATMRGIANELGMSLGTLTHYFKSRDEILMHALDRVSSITINTMREAADRAQGQHRLRDALLAVLPFNTRNSFGWQIWSAFVGASIGKPELREQLHQRDVIFREFVQQELERWQHDQAPTVQLETRKEALALLNFVDGLGIGALINPEPVAQIKARLERYLKRNLDL